MVHSNRWPLKQGHARTDSVRAIWDIGFAQPDPHPKGLLAVEHQRVTIFGHDFAGYGGKKEKHLVKKEAREGRGSRHYVTSRGSPPNGIYI